MKRTRPEPLVALSLLAATAAAETTFEPRVAVSETFTTNVRLAPRGAEDGDWITQVRPGFTASRDGPRLRYDLDYDLQALYFAGENDGNDTFHNFVGDGEGELIEDRFFVEMNGRYDQRDVDPANRQATSNLFLTDNRTDVAALEVSPLLLQPIGEVAIASLRYTWSMVDYRETGESVDTTSTGGSVQDSDLDRTAFRLESPEEARWIWHLDYINASVSFDEASDYKYETAGGEVGIPVAARSHLLLGAGRESNPDQSREDGGLDDNWWTVGWQWQPTARQNVELRTGRRYYGPSYDVSWQRAGSRGQLEIEYHESPTTTSALEFDKYSVTPDGLFGQARIDTSVFIRKRLSGLVTWNATRSDWSLRLYREERDLIDDAETDEDFSEDEQVLGLRAGVMWQAFVRTTLDASLSWEDQQFEEGDATTGQIGVALVRSVTRNVEGRLGISRLFKNSEVIQDYRDTSVTVELAWNL